MTLRKTSAERVARVAALKMALDTKQWGPFHFEIDRPKGFVKEWPQDDGSVKKYKYPVDYGYFVKHTGEDDEGLDAFVGDDPTGKIESFMKMRRDDDGKLIEDETKFLIGLTAEERKKVMGLYEKSEIVDLREYEDFYELVNTLKGFRDKTASRVASRFIQARASVPDRLRVNGIAFDVISTTSNGLFIYLSDPASPKEKHVLAYHERAGWTLDRKPVKTMTAG